MSGLATAPKHPGTGATVGCPCCHKRVSYNAARTRAIAAQTEAERVRAEPRYGDTLPVEDILPLLDGMGRFIGRGQYVLLPIRGLKDRRGRCQIYSDGILAPGVNWAQVHSRRTLATALIRADRAGNGFCSRCTGIEIELALPLHLSFDGDDTRLYCLGGFFAPSTADGELSFIEWGDELRAEGYDIAGDPRFHGEWAEGSHRGVVLRRSRKRQGN